MGMGDRHPYPGFMHQRHATTACHSIPAVNDASHGLAPVRDTTDSKNCSMNNSIHCFLDESGDPHFPAGESGRSSHYVLASVLVTSERLAAVRDHADSIRREHFGNGEMKAGTQSRRKDSSRRVAIVTALAQLDVAFAVIAVDKGELADDGPLAAWKKSFLKFTARQLLERLYGTHDEVHVVADEYGRASYQHEFERYVGNRLGLFGGGSTFEFGDSKTEPLIQVADFVAGTVFRAQRDKTEEGRTLLGLFRPRIHTYIAWPTIFRSVEPVRGFCPDAARDHAVRELSLESAHRFLAANRGSRDPEVAARVACLDRLLFTAQFDERTAFVSARELTSVVGTSSGGRDKPSSRWLSGSIIGPLRDAGVVISGSPKGYAVPFRAAELDAHVHDVRSKTIPMLRRLSRYRDDLRLRTKGSVDLLDGPHLSDVRSLVDLLNDPSAPPA